MGLSLNLAACLIVTTAFTTTLAADTVKNSFNLKPFKIDLASEIPHLKSVVNNTRLPAKALYPDASPEKGIGLDVLQELRTDWLTKFDWEAQQAELNQSVSRSTFPGIYLITHTSYRVKQFIAVIEGQTVHFVHEKSKDPDAIPVILLHGWPGNFLSQGSS
jgi:hypothetical protein